MKFIIIFFAVYLICSCNSKSQNTSTLKIFPENDSCYYLRNDKTNEIIEAFRKIRIVENTLTDTISLGFVILPPRYVGEFFYLRVDERVDAAIDPELDDKYWPKTRMFCINLYEHKPVKGKLVIQYSY